MKNFLLIIISAVFVTFISCNKDKECKKYTESTIVASADEKKVITDYLTSKNLTATEHSSGIFYSITDEGNGELPPTLCDEIVVKYKGTLLNGIVFDENSTFYSILGKLIVGWQKGIPLISKTGKITLYIPPSMGYGSNDNGLIPANSTLIFEIELLNHD